MSNNIPKDAYAIIIGAMKCGTSSLYIYLKEHPEICPAMHKEPEFFSDNQGHGVKVDNYNDLWNFDNSVHKYALEASTGYTKYPSELNVSENIRNYGIRPKFIYIIRNPFDRISSHFNFMQRHEAWHLSIDGKHLLNTSNYFLQLEQYRKYFPIRDILLLDFDELKNNPKQLLQRIYSFLGLSNDYFPIEYNVKNPTHFVSRSVLMLSQTKLSGFFGFFPKPLKKIGKEMLLRIFPPPRKRILTNRERAIVYNELRESMISLHNIYGFKVQKWGFDI